MNRRNFLKILGGPTLVSGVQKLLQAQQQPVYPLETVADEGTMLDKALAEKAYQVAFNVATQVKHPGVLYTSKPLHLQGNIGGVDFDARYHISMARMKIDRNNFEVEVTNANEIYGTREYGKKIEHGERDRLLIKIEKDLGTCLDIGLDGRVNHCSISPRLNDGNGLHYTGSSKEEDRRMEAQAFYEKTLDKIIMFYKSGQ